MRYLPTIAFLFCMLAVAAQEPPYLNPKLPLQERVADLLRRMTLEEKVSQMMNKSAAIDRLHITNASLYIRGTNLLTFATDKYLSYDPEAGVASATNFEVFIPKTIAGGIKIGF